MKLNSKKYTTEVKREVVTLVIKQGHNYVEAAQILKINATTAARGE